MDINDYSNISNKWEVIKRVIVVGQSFLYKPIVISGRAVIRRAELAQARTKL